MPPQLTRYQLAYPNQPPAYFDQPEDALAAQNQAMIEAAQAASAPIQPMGPDAGPAEVPDDTSGAGVPLNTVPALRHPSFQEATTDEYGNTRPAGPGLTKLGKLMGFLAAAGRGAVDALATPGALDAAPGKSYFGAGMAGAQVMPLVRAQRAYQMRAIPQEEELRQMQIEQARGNVAMLPVLRRRYQGEEALREAQTEYYKARAKEPYRPDTETPTGREQFLEDHPELRQRMAPEQQQEFILYGTRTPQERPVPNINETQLWLDAQQPGPEGDAARAALKAKGEQEANLRRISNAPGQPGRLTPNESRQIEAKKADRYAKLHEFRWDEGRGQFRNGKTGESMSQEDYARAEQEIEDAYHAEIRASGGTPDTRSVAEVRAGKGQTAYGSKKAIGPTVAEVEAAKKAVPQGRVLVWKDGKFAGHIPAAQADQAESEGYKVFR